MQRYCPRLAPSLVVDRHFSHRVGLIYAVLSSRRVQTGRLDRLSLSCYQPVVCFRLPSNGFGYNDLSRKAGCI